MAFARWIAKEEEESSPEAEVSPVFLARASLLFPCRRYSHIWNYRFDQHIPYFPPPPIIVSSVNNVEQRYSAGSSAVNGEQHGFSEAWKFISSTRTPSGS